MTGTRISTPSDFPHTAVYADGSVYTVAFDNLEYSNLRKFTTVIIGTAIVILGVVVLVGFTARAATALGLPEFAGPAASAAIGIFLFWRGAMRPFKFKRAIELDFGHDELRVLKNGKPVIRRQLTRLANLTVEDHPEAEMNRLNRQARGQNNILIETEKQHCLIGWFGAGGAEQVMLLTRAEYPSRHSLFEVRQAIMWAMERASAGGTQQAGPEPLAPSTETIKPPLD